MLINFFSLAILKAVSSYENNHESVRTACSINRTFITGSETGTLRLWPIPMEEGPYNEMFVLRQKN
jgi:hypothetical protein